MSSKSIPILTDISRDIKVLKNKENYSGSVESFVISVLNKNISVLKKEGIINNNVKEIIDRSGLMEEGNFSKNIIKLALYKYSGKIKLIKALCIALLVDKWAEKYFVYYNENDEPKTTNNKPINKVIEKEINKGNNIKKSDKKGKKEIPHLHIFLKNVIKNKASLVTLGLGVFSVLIYFLSNSFDEKFTVSISNFDAVDYNEVFRDDNPTSPLCGCLNDSVAHDGIMIPAQYCKITDKKGKEPLSNFLITCPDHDEIGAFACFSFDTKIYRFNGAKYKEMGISELSSLIEADSSELKSQNFMNNGFCSIVTSKEIEVFSRDEESIIAFIGSANGTTSVKKVIDKYGGNVSKIGINNHGNLNDKDAKYVKKVPAVDINSKKIFIKWIDSLYLLTPKGASLNKDINLYIAVIEPKNSVRISILPWNKQIEASWNWYYLSQFGEEGNYIMFHNVPVIDSKTGAPVHFENIKSYRTPNMFGLNSDVNIEIKKLMKDSIYNHLYSKYIKDGGYYFEFKKDDFRIGKPEGISNNMNDSNIINKISYMENQTDPQILLEKEREIQEIEKIENLKGMYWAKSKITEEDTQMLKGIREYFRYPPIHKEKGISFYTKFFNIKFSNCNGLLQIGKTHFNIYNQLLEIEDLHNVEYDYPALFTGIAGDTKVFTIKGYGKVKIDGHIIGETRFESFFENKYLALSSNLATLVSFLITIFSSLFIKKRKI